jgi:very-short-patch-repair endonuclease
LVVECDGSIHHENDQWNHDQHRDAYMISRGLRVVRLTNEEILTDISVALARITTYLPSPFGRGD